MAQISSLTLYNISSVSVHTLHFASGYIDLGPFCVNMRTLSQLNAQDSAVQRSHYSPQPWQDQDQVYTVLCGSWHTFTIYSNFLLVAEGFLGNMVKLYDTSNLAVEPTQKPVLTLSGYFV